MWDVGCRRRQLQVPCAGLAGEERQASSWSHREGGEGMVIIADIKQPGPWQLMSNKGEEEGKERVAVCVCQEGEVLERGWWRRGHGQ